MSATKSSLMDNLLKDGRTWHSWRKLKIEAELALLDCSKTLVMSRIGCNGLRKIVQCSGRASMGSTRPGCPFQLVFAAVKNKEKEDGLKNVTYVWHFVQDSTHK